MPPAFKAVVVGDSCIGKTSFLNVLCKGTFCEVAPTIGVDYFVYRHGIDRIAFYDTAGAERYFAITKTYFRNSDLALLFVDLSKASSTDSLDRWYAEAEPHAKRIVLIGSKHDVSCDQGVREFELAAQRLRLTAFKVASKTGEGVGAVKAYVHEFISESQRPVYADEPVETSSCCI